MDINESPVYVLLNPLINHAQKDLPVSIFESGMLSKVADLYCEYDCLWILSC